MAQFRGQPRDPFRPFPLPASGRGIGGNERSHGSRSGPTGRATLPRRRGPPLARLTATQAGHGKSDRRRGLVESAILR